MNIEKAIYLNTLTAAEETERKGRVVSAYTAGRIHGGVRFVMRGRGKARLIAAYRALTEQTSLSLDGKPIAVTLRPYTEVELCLDKGEHFFSADSPASHGGLTLIVEGAGVKGDGPYLDRVGGAYSASECVVYLKRGDGRVEKWVYDGSSLSCSARTERYFDEAYLYDAVGNTYLSTKRFCYAGTQNFTVNNGVSTVFSHDGVRSLAMCDGRSLSGADYLVAFVDTSLRAGSRRGQSDERGCFGYRRGRSPCGQRGARLDLLGRRSRSQLDGVLLLSRGRERIILHGIHCALRYDRDRQNGRRCADRHRRRSGRAGPILPQGRRAVDG